MLPNPKNNKSINNLLSNSVESSIDEVQNNQKKLQTKRKTIIISLVLTAGLSFIFWSYKSVQSLIKSPKTFNLNLKFKLPKFSFIQNYHSSNPSSANIDKFLDKSLVKWSVFISLDTDYSKPVFEYQSSLFGVNNNFNQIIDKFNTIESSSHSLINLSLPQGLSFQEIVDKSSSVYYQGLIHLPKNKILLLIKNNDLTNDSQAQIELPLLIDHLYWYAVGCLD